MDNKSIIEAISEYQYVSFDIFDTLLIRSVLKPEDIFTKIDEDHKFGTLNFKEYRINAFIKACQLYENETCQEVTFDQIYECIDSRFKEYKKFELEYESKCLFPNNSIKEIYDYCRKSKKTIILISDMYLPKNVISEILIKSGYSDFRLFLSSEYKKLKYTSDLYLTVLKELNISSDQIVHVGDNEQVDCVAAGRVGIKSLKIESSYSIFCNSDPSLKYYHDNIISDFSTSLILGLYAWHNRTFGFSYWEKIGYLCGGPLIVSYLQWLLRQSKQDDISDFLFVARDGFVLKRALDLLTKNKIRTNYIYTPRIICLATDYNFDFNDKRNSSTEEEDCYLTFINYYDEEIKRELSIDVSKLNKAQQIELFLTHQEFFRDLAKKEFNKYCDYLNSLNITGSKVAFVDMSTNFFTGQRLIERAYSKKNIDVIGFYQTVFKNFKVDRNSHNFRVHSYQSYNVPFGEFLITAPEPPIKSLDRFGVFYQDIPWQESLRFKAYQRIFRGELQFVEDYIKFVKDPLNQNLSSESCINLQNNFICNPSKIDKEMFSEIYYAFDSSHHNYQKIFPEWYK
ncbi:succinate dehydrogenase iron-sulfur protein [Sutterella sp. CAG:351]|uniref:succinate dehydrogenase iron-sulfur protein n=1 Tax=Dakarella massiliensis TaxID=1506471 RepID=UPI00033A020F|nr:succinate dehydrogenase iron-sulfur protein [Dakarella massiliensis]CDE48336.1 succinate dehydrogenase iron-sulfur protein [Sutterella sp. CAG:351]